MPSAKPQKNLDHIRHSLAHLLGAAVRELYGNDAKLAIGPAIEHGFYYDIKFPESVKINENDLKLIEKQMRKILPAWDIFKGRVVDIRTAKKLFPRNEFKTELIDEIAKKRERITIYKSGNFEDLCKGGHVKNAKEIEQNAFILDSVAGAYWRGDEKNPMLTRIYGLAFGSKKELDAYLVAREEAEKRDHRKFGQELDIFMISDIVGKGLPIWLPNGTIIRNEIEKLAVEMENAYGYERVATPHIAKAELFKRSGHLPYYAESMFPPMKMDDGTYYLKAMNCPITHLVYAYKPRSYRELPIRLAEYGTVYRNELSGTLAGLLRVRMLSMNDAHIYCTKDQIAEEFKSAMRLTLEYFKVFGLKEYWFRLSKWNPKNKKKYINEPANWHYAESILRKVLRELKVTFVETADEAAFYGPKVDVQFKSIVGREETMSTIQLDFAAKKCFGLYYTDKNGKKNDNVFVIHRAPLSTHERFIAFLLEHFAGAFPLWLAPVQVAVLPVSEKQKQYAEKLSSLLKERGIRAESHDADETLGKRIRLAETKKIPYILVVGEKEVERKTASVRHYRRGQEGEVELAKLIDILSREAQKRSL